jgi:hypothetical protein
MNLNEAIEQSPLFKIFLLCVPGTRQVVRATPHRSVALFCAEGAGLEILEQTMVVDSRELGVLEHRCAWCSDQRLLSVELVRPESAGISHGMCERCRATQALEAKGASA